MLGLYKKFLVWIETNSSLVAFGIVLAFAYLAFGIISGGGVPCLH